MAPIKLCLLSYFVISTLAGCSSLVEAQSNCTATNPSYLKTWECIRDKVAKNQAGNMNNDLGLRYLAIGDLLAEKVRKKQLSDLEAKALLASEMETANSKYNARRREALNDFLQSLPKTTSCREVSGGLTCTTW
jgi:hypothetical protein